MSDLVRFGVAMERALLAEFDGRIAARGYENRSEALRDLVRADLTRAAWDGGALVAATVTAVYHPDVKELVMRLSQLTLAEGSRVLSSLSVFLDGGRCLEVTVLRGRASDISAFSGRVAGTKGVMSCELTVAARVEGAR
jgi:CopG family transcriptional regulator, nickel-responsive regulator